jgi:hypothetical protein
MTIICRYIKKGAAVKPEIDMHEAFYPIALML